MLQKLHDNIKGWVASVLLGLICLAFVLWGVERYVSNEGSKGQTLAKVAGKKITDQDVNRVYQQMQRRLSAQNRAITAQMREQLKMMALQQLVGETALTQAAIKSGFYVDKTQVQQIITSLPQFQNQGRFSPQLFTQFIYASGLTQTQFIDEIKQQMLISQVANGIERSNFVLPNELAVYYGLLNQKRNFSYLTIPVGKFSNQISISTQDEKNYYQNNEDRFRLPEQVSISYIMISPKELSKDVKVTDSELQQYYQDNLSNYRTPWVWNIDRITVKLPQNPTSQQIKVARDKMQAVLAEIKKGKKFSVVMKENHGVSQTVNQADVSAELITVLRKLKVNQVSEPFNTPVGYSVVRLTKVTRPSVKSFANVKNSINKMLVHQKIQQKLEAMGDKLTNLTYTNPDSLDEAAKALKVKIQQSPLFSRLGTKTGVSANPQVVEAAFSEDVLEDRNNSNVLTLKDGSVIVLRVNKHVASQLRPFSEVQKTIHTELVQKNEQAQAALLAEKVQSELAKGTSLTQVAAKQKLALVSQNNIARNDKKIKPAVLAAAFNLSLQKGRNSTVVEFTNGDTAVVVLMAIDLPDFSKISAKDKQGLQVKLQQFFGGLTYELYSAGVKQDSGIKYYTVK